MVKDPQGAVLFESGKPTINGAIEGNDNDIDRNTFEPHFEVLTKPEQVQIYETIMANTDQEVTYTLLRAGSYLKDNRLLPEGFDKKSAQSDTAVFGQANNDDDFDGGGDLVTYQIEQDNFKNIPLTVTVKLLFEPVSYAFVEDLKQYKLIRVQDFIYYWQKVDKTPVLISSDEVTINK